MGETDLAAAFEAERGRLRGVAYRMLGSAAEAEDAVQEAWLRVERSDMGAVENIGGWLTIVVARICLDMLRARDTRAEEPLDEERSEARAGGIDPAEELALARSVGLALLVVLEELSPPERVAFVLHDLFDRPFAEIGPIIGKSEEATRQLASRARRRVRGAEAPPAPDIAAQCELVEAFLAASRDGELEKIVAILDPDVVFRADSAAMRGKRAQEVRGAERVSKMYKGRAQGAGLALLDGRPGIVVTAQPGQVMLLIRLTFADGRIAAIDVTGDPEKIRATEIGVA
ncbi:MAG TPA: sigma-70 family RNA polymerase sigma factor [Usitatibacter sp.]